MSKQFQAAREAQLTKDEALAWAEAYYREHKKWPKRRWRVEGSPAGNSGLLTRGKAIRTQALHGGEIVEVICEARYYRDLCRQKGRIGVIDS